MEPNFEITLKCGECDGEGAVGFGHPIDPSSKEVDCYSCDGSGKSEPFGEVYDCLEDAKADYPDAEIKAL